jgi:hypothetical protein
VPKRKHKPTPQEELERFVARLTAEYVSEALARGDDEPRRRVLESLKLREAASAKAAKAKAS